METFPQELQDYITHGKEETNLEYKASMKWSSRPRTDRDKGINYKIIKAMLAMSNNADGGLIVIGAKEKRNGEFKPTGISKRNYDSFKYDAISQALKNICSPLLQFKISRGGMTIDGKEKRFVVIQVAEAIEFPVVCTALAKYNNSEPAYPQNILLRENAIYIRSKAPIESREIANLHEWQDLIYRIIERSKKELLKRMPCSEFIATEVTKKETQKADKIESQDSKKFDEQQKKDNL